MSEFFEQPIEEEIPYDNVVEVVPFEETPEEIDVDLVLDFTAKLIPYVDKAITVVEESEEETSPEYQELIDEIRRLKGDMETVQINLGGMAESSETYNDLMAEGAQLNWEMTRAMESASIEIGNLGQQAADLWTEVDTVTGYAQDAADSAAAAEAAVNEAIASSNGSNTRNTSTRSPLDNPIATENLNGKPLISGDTWWQITGSATRKVIGQWSWDGSTWKAEEFGTQVIANLDVSKLTAGIASMDILAAKKMAVDFGAFKVLTTDKLAVVSTDGGVYPDPMFLDPGLGALRASNSGTGVTYNEAANNLTTSKSIWLTRESLPESKTIPLVEDTLYSISIWGTNLTDSTWKLALWGKGGSFYTTISGTSYSTGRMSTSIKIPVGMADGRFQLYKAGVPSTTISRVEIRQGIGGTLIENGAITTDKVFAGAIGTDQLAANAVTVKQMAVGDLSNYATIDYAIPGNVSYGTPGDDYWEDGVLESGYGGNPWSIRVPETTSSIYFMFRPNTGPVPIQTGDRIRMTFEAYGHAGVEDFTTTLWTYPARSGSSLNMVPPSGAPSLSLTTTPKKFVVEGLVTSSGVEGRTTFLIGMSGLSPTARPRVRNVRAYRMGAGELVVDGSISGNVITGGVITGTTIRGVSIEGVDISGTSTITGARFLTGGGGDRIEISSAGNWVRAYQSSVRRMELNTSSLEFYKSGGTLAGTVEGRSDGLYLGGGDVTVGYSGGKVSLGGDQVLLSSFNKVVSTSLWHEIEVLNTNPGFGKWLFRPLDIGGITRNTLQFSAGGSNMPQTSLAANLYIDSNGSLYRSTSRREHKLDIRDSTFNPSTILNLRWRDWVDRSASMEDPEYTTRTMGVVAEEAIEDGLGVFVPREEDGTAAGFDYDRAWLPLVPLTREIMSRLEALESELGLETIISEGS